MDSKMEGDISMAYLDVEGLSVYYEVRGQGEPIILLHQGFNSSKMWQGIYPQLVASGYQTILYDRRGYGFSEEGSDFIDFYRSQDFRTSCVHELEELRKHIGLESFHLVGQCEGGVVASDYTAIYPQHVHTLVTSSTQCYSTMTMKELNALKFPKIFSDLDHELQRKLTEFHGADRAEFRYNLHRSYGGCYGSDYFDLRPVLQSVSRPALVIFPDRSFIFNVEQGLAFYKNLQNGQLAVLPKCGHNTYEHQPNEYLHQLFNFWARLP